MWVRGEGSGRLVKSPGVLLERCPRQCQGEPWQPRVLPPLDASSSLVCPDANPVLPCSPLPFNSLLRAAAAALPSTASERMRGIRGKRAPGVLLEVLRGKNSRLLFLVLRVLGL